MSHHVEELLPAYLLGESEQAARVLVEAHLAECEACRALGRSTSEALAWLASSTEVSASTILRDAEGARTKLFASVDHLERYASFTDRVAALLDLTTQQARSELHLFSDDEGWDRFILPGVAWRPARIGPRHKGSTAMLARISASANIPAHRHIRREEMLILEGALTDSLGRTAVAGETIESDPSSTHIVRGDDAVGCSCIVLAEGGVDWIV